VEQSWFGCLVAQEVLLNVAPKKANWDLRRDIAPKLARLERRTQVSKALVHHMVVVDFIVGLLICSALRRNVGVCLSFTLKLICMSFTLGCLLLTLWNVSCLPARWP
jgi:hypothetical protein